MLDQSNDIITGLQDQVVVRTSNHHPRQVHALVLIVAVSIHQSVDGQTEGPSVSESSGKQLGEQ